MKRITRDQVLLTEAEWRLLARTLDLLRRVEDALGRGPEDGQDAWEFVEMFEKLAPALERLVAKHHLEPIH